MKLRRLLYSGIATLGIAALGSYAYFAQRAPAANADAGKPVLAGQKTAAPATVEVTTVSRAKLREDINAVGTIRSNESVILKPEVAGRITRLNFSDGQQVQKGHLLVGFDATVNLAEVRQAKAELAIAAANFTRNADLARQKFISERAKDESDANVQVLEAKLALAQARLAKLEIKAPFSGIVGIRTVSVGDYVKDGAELVNLDDVSSVKVDFRVPEKFADRTARGQLIEVNVDALPGRVFTTKVDAIDPQVDASGRSSLLRGRIANTDGKLKPGMFARVRLILSERPNALVVPEEAIVPQGDKVTVWKVVDGKVQRIEVTAGLRRAAKVEILSGLALGDTIVTAGQTRLAKNGAPVRIAQPAPALKPVAMAATSSVKN
jgi:membrane fusion protein (multidrug efflux system)